MSRIYKNTGISVGNLQRHRHAKLNCFSDSETLVQAVSSRPGIPGSNPLCHLALVARRPTIVLADIDEAIVTDKTLIRAGVGRGNVCLLTSRDYPMYFRALQDVLRETGLKTLVGNGISVGELQRCADALRHQDWSGESREIIDVLQILYPQTHRRPQGDVAGLLLRKLCDIGVLVRTGTKGVYSNHFAYALLAQWFPAMQLTKARPEVAQTELLKRYLKSNTAASVQDMVWWTGLPEETVQRALQRLQKDTAVIRVPECDQPLIVLKDSVERLEKDACIEQPIAFVPPWDPYTLGWQDKDLIVKSQWQPWVYASSTNCAGAVIECGQVIGVWQVQTVPTAVLQVHVFSTWKDRETAVFAQAEAFSKLLTQVLELSSIQTQSKPLPQDSLPQRPNGAFLWPLGQPQKQQTSLIERRRCNNTFRQTYLHDAPSSNGNRPAA